jgi:pimeloyl-ACP methyl ester carboxylesterase
VGILSHRWILCPAAAVLAVAGCVSRLDTASTIAQSGGLQPQIVAAGTFDLKAYSRIGSKGSPLTVYIEGDGFAWMTPTRASDDPTPKEPTGLQMAAADRSDNVVWLARPCQYTGGLSARGCSTIYWTDGRYAESVVNSLSLAIDQFTAKAGPSHIRLVGYSGGGAVATLLAARRRDVGQLITVAAVLDAGAWTQGERLTPLWRSLEPAETAEVLSTIPQVHFVGADDHDVPPWVAASFARRFGPNRRPLVIEIPGYDHRCCWAAHWGGLLDRAEREMRRP